MQTIESELIPTDDIAAVEESLAALQDSPLAAQLQALVRVLREGTDVTFLSANETLTPNQAAKMLQISRPLVMSLIKRGELEARIVGTRDHRIPVSEVTGYIERRDRAMRDVAASFGRTTSSEEELVARAAGISPERAAEMGI
jgi:excisionase family DNA binding protein